VRRRLTAALALAAGLLAGGAAAGPGLLVTVGDVSSTTAVVWARPAGETTVGVEARPSAGGTAITATARATKRGDQTVKVPLAGLTPATRYTWEIRAAGESVTGEFVTAPMADQATRVHFLWSGDLGGGGRCRLIDGGYPIFRAMARHKPDFFLFEGDTIYADVKCDTPGVLPGANFVARSLGEYRGRHRYNREEPAVQAFFRTTAVYAIWDDHEVRNDFSGPSDPLMPTGRRAFLEYFPIIPPDDEPNRLYRKFRWGRLLEIFILDTRQYRSPNTQTDGPGKTMLGAAQRRWLVDNVSTSTAVWKMVVSSVPLSIPTGKPERRDSWSNANVYGTPQEGGTGFAVERDAILRSLRARGVKNLVFLVADVHHAELIRHHPTPEWSFHEFVAGPLSASTGRPRPLDQALNPRSLFARGGVYTFGEVVIEPGSLVVRLLDVNGAMLFTHTVGPE
jgi:alkaline phosphatase D